MKVRVLNRSRATVVYTLEDDRITRTFAPNEEKELDSSEMEKLTYQPGGSKLIEMCLLIKDAETVNNLIGEQEPEYWMDLENIKKEIIDCSVDRFKDILDFAPEGCIDIIKDLAVSLPLRDSFKMDALREKTGFDARKAIELMKDEDGEQQAAPSKRRVAVESKPAPAPVTSSRFEKVK